MPTRNRNIQIFTELADALKLIIDQSFQRGNVQHLQPCFPIFDTVQRRNECRLRFPRCRRSGQNQVMIGIGNLFDGRTLNIR